jgi:hypothetical protein
MVGPSVRATRNFFRSHLSNYERKWKNEERREKREGEMSVFRFKDELGTESEPHGSSDV